jgi:hypothetical protein
MMKIIAIGAVALVTLVGVAFAADFGPFAPSAEERIAAHLGHDVNCRHGGLTELAGERETYYRCSWHRPATDNFPGRYEQRCAAVVEGRVYSVSC